MPIEAFIEGYGWRVSVVYPGKDGHYPTGDWPNDGTQRMPWFVPGPAYSEALEQVAEMNDRRGIGREDALKGVNQSMALGRLSANANR